MVKPQPTRALALTMLSVDTIETSADLQEDSRPQAILTIAWITGSATSPSLVSDITNISTFGDIFLLFQTVGSFVIRIP